MFDIEKFTDDMLRARAEFVYRRKLTDAEWAAKRQHRSDPFDVGLALTEAKVALDLAAKIAEDRANELCAAAADMGLRPARDQRDEDDYGRIASRILAEAAGAASLAVTYRGLLPPIEVKPE